MLIGNNAVSRHPDTAIPGFGRFRLGVRPALLQAAVDAGATYPSYGAALGPAAGASATHALYLRLCELPQGQYAIEEVAFVLHLEGTSPQCDQAYFVKYEAGVADVLPTDEAFAAYVRGYWPLLEVARTSTCVVLGALNLPIQTWIGPYDFLGVSVHKPAATAANCVTGVRVTNIAGAPQDYAWLSFVGAGPEEELGQCTAATSPLFMYMKLRAADGTVFTITSTTATTTGLHWCPVQDDGRGVKLTAAGFNPFSPSQFGILGYTIDPLQLLASGGDGLPITFRAIFAPIDGAPLGWAYLGIPAPSGYEAIDHHVEIVAPAGWGSTDGYTIEAWLQSVNALLARTTSKYSNLTDGNSIELGPVIGHLPDLIKAHNTSTEAASIALTVASL